MEKSRKDRVKGGLLKLRGKMWGGRQNAKKKETEKPAEPELSKKAEEAPSPDIMVNIPQLEKDETSPMETSQAEEGH